MIPEISIEFFAQQVQTFPPHVKFILKQFDPISLVNPEFGPCHQTEKIMITCAKGLRIEINIYRIKGVLLRY